MSNEYYVQKLGYVGNCLMWWRKGDNGYTLDLDDAQVFDREAARSLVMGYAKKYVAWEKDYVDTCAGCHVDSQNIRKDCSGFTDEVSASKDLK